MKILAAITLGLALLSCGSNKDDCMAPADCFGKQEANTCLLIKGHYRCVSGNCAPGMVSTCPFGYVCGGTSDDGKPYCTGSLPSGGGSPDAR
jgi:hypothetical protein